MLNKKIISVSKKTDIPAFFSEWFMDKIKKGYCSYPNTFNPNAIYKCSLKPEDVLVFVFWTKNPKPLMKYLKTLDEIGYKYYFQFTVSPYGKFMEPNVPSVEERVEIFKELSSMIGKEKVIWRYDPIIISDKTDYQYHILRFEKLAEQLKTYTEKVVISILDNYKLINKRMPVQNFDNDMGKLIQNFEFINFIKKLISISENAGIIIESCAENIEKFGDIQGIRKGSCIDKEVIQKILNLDMEKYDFKKSDGERENCLCLDHIDIGMYNTCPHECHYCYANNKIQREKNISIDSDTLVPVNSSLRSETKKKGILKKAIKKKNENIKINNHQLF